MGIEIELEMDVFNSAGSPLTSVVQFYLARFCLWDRFCFDILKYYLRKNIYMSDIINNKFINVPGTFLSLL